MNYSRTILNEQARTGLIQWALENIVIEKESSKLDSATFHIFLHLGLNWSAERDGFYIILHNAKNRQEKIDQITSYLEAHIK